MSRLLTPLAIGLAICYGVVGYLVLRPNVTDAYRQYYIDRSSKLSMAEARRIAPLNLNHIYRAGSQEVVFNKWSELKEERLAPAWPSALIFFDWNQTVGTSDETAVRLSLWSVENPQGSLRVVVNGRLLYSRALTGPRLYEIPVPNGFLRLGINEIEFDVCGSPSESGCDFARTIQFSSLSRVR